jgi:hypothetical protein
VSLVIALGLVGCVGSSAGKQLYAGPLRSSNEVARLSGPIVSVDGQDVPSGGGSFFLLPGCHVVHIGGRIGDTSPVPGLSRSATLPSLVYAFRMRAGHSYSIAIEPEPELGRRSTFSAKVGATETDAQGKRSRVPAAHSSDDISECVRWAASGAASG